MNGPQIIGLIRCHYFRSRVPACPQSREFVLLGRNAVLNVSKKKKKKNLVGSWIPDTLGMQGLDGLQRRGAGSPRQSWGQTSCASLAKVRLSPTRGEGRALDGLGSHQKHFLCVLISQPGVGFSHKGEVNPENQSELCNGAGKGSDLC